MIERMRKAGVPEEAILQRLNLKPSPSPVRYDSMRRVGVPDAAISQQMQIDVATFDISCKFLINRFVIIFIIF